MFLFKLLELLDASGVSAFTERGCQKYADDLADFVFVEQIGAEAQDVAVIVLAREAGGGFVVGGGGAGASFFFCGPPDAAAAAGPGKDPLPFFPRPGAVGG